MQLKVLFTVALFGGSVLSSPLERRQDGPEVPIVKALQTMTSAIKDLTTSVNSFTGDVNDGAKILIQADALLATLDQQTKSFASIPVLEISPAARVLTPGNNLVNEVEKVVTALISKKPEFQKNGLTPVVHDTLVNFKSAAQKTVVVITEKLPTNVKSVGKGIGERIEKQIEKGLAVYPK